MRTGKEAGRPRVLWHSNQFRDWDLTNGSTPREDDVVLFGGGGDQRPEQATPGGWSVATSYLTIEAQSMVRALVSTPFERRDEPCVTLGEQMGGGQEEVHRKIMRRAAMTVALLPAAGVCRGGGPDAGLQRPVQGAPIRRALFNSL